MESPVLWQQYKKGNREAFRQLYMDHIDDLMAYGQKICQDSDILQDTVHDLFVYIWEKRETIGETDSIIKYLCVSLRRRLVKNIEEQTRTSHQVDMENNMVYMTTSIETELIVREDNVEKQKLLSVAISKLPKRQQEALHLKYYQNLSYEEICTLMDINYQSVRNLISKAIIDLRHLL